MVVRMAFTGVMAAIVCIITTFHISVGQSRLHFANSMCLLSGLLLGPVWGGTAAGLGSAINDIISGEYGFVDALITFATKFAMAWVCGLLFRLWVVKPGRLEKPWNERLPLVAAACAAGALSYVALYILRSWIFLRFVTPVPPETIPTVLWTNLLASLFNAGFAVVTAPIFYHAVRPALKAGGLLTRLEGQKNAA